MTGQTVKRKRSNYRRYAKCKDCKVQGTYSVPLSARQLCYPCGELRLAANIRSMKSGVGEGRRKWAEGMLRAYIAATGGNVIPITARQTSAKGSRTERSDSKIA